MQFFSISEMHWQRCWWLIDGVDNDDDNDNDGHNDQKCIGRGPRGTRGDCKQGEAYIIIIVVAIIVVIMIIIIVVVIIIIISILVISWGVW